MKIFIFRIFGIILIGAASLSFYGLAQTRLPSSIIAYTIRYGFPTVLLLLGLWAFLREAPYKVRKPSIHPNLATPPVPIATDLPRYFVDVSGEQTGPLTLQQLREAWEAGTFTGENLLWFEGATEWKQLSAVPNLLAYSK